MKKLESDYNRVNLKSGLYFDIVYNSFSKILTDFKQINKNDIEESKKIASKIFQEYHIIIVFAVMAIESFVNNYMASCLNDEFFESNLDKLNLKQKLEVIHTLFWEKDFDKSNNTYRLLDSVLKTRNSFVHSKTKNFQTWFEKNKDSIPVIKCSKEDDFEAAYAKTAIEQAIDYLKRAFAAIQAVYKIAELFDTHDDKALAKVVILDCLHNKNSFFIEQQEKDIDTIIKELKNEIKKLE